MLEPGTLTRSLHYTGCGETNGANELLGDKNDVLSRISPRSPGIEIASFHMAHCSCLQGLVHSKPISGLGTLALRYISLRLCHLGCLGSLG